MEVFWSTGRLSCLCCDLGPLCRSQRATEALGVREHPGSSECAQGKVSSLVPYRWLSLGILDCSRNHPWGCPHCYKTATKLTCLVVQLFSVVTEQQACFYWFPFSQCWQKCFSHWPLIWSLLSSRCSSLVLFFPGTSYLLPSHSPLQGKRANFPLWASTLPNVCVTPCASLGGRAWPLGKADLEKPVSGESLEALERPSRQFSHGCRSYEK